MVLRAGQRPVGRAGSGIRAGTEGWVGLRLGPGRYELLGNRRNHYVDGMYRELDVV